MLILLRPLLRYIIGAVIVIVLLLGIYLKGRHDGSASVQHKVDAAIAEEKAKQVVELQKQAADSNRIITDLENRTLNRHNQVQTIIKTVRVPDNKECILDKDAIDSLNKVRHD